MSMTLQELQSALSIVQEELQQVRQRLRELGEVVSIERDGESARHVRLRCTDLTLHSAYSTESVALHLGEKSGAGFLHLHYPLEPQVAAELSFQNDGEPQLTMRGRDGSSRAEIFVQEDCGWMAVLSKDGRPGALMRAQDDGGSVAVLQADGQARAVLIHGGNEETQTDREVLPVSTNLIFADGQGNATLKLRADAGGGMLTAGVAGQSDAIALVARADGPALLMHAPDESHSISLMAMSGVAEVCVHENKVPGQGTQSSLMAGEFGSSLTLRGIGGQKAVDLSALDVASSLTLHDGKGEMKVMLAHHFGSHSAMTLQGMTEEDGIRIIASEEVSSMEVMSPADPETKILTAVTTEKPVCIVQKQHRPIVMLGEGDLGGMICAYGPDKENAGIASISGGSVSGSLVLATVDGTAQLTLDATDHGGRLLINNDLGFQRVAMGVYEEAGGLHLNNTGSIGIQAIATPKGGIVTVSDHDGRPIATLPESDGEDTGDWGRLPDSF
ncbi:MAG: hypothetical protein RL015_1060 [Verrucomicrobiota bacterium]|jgi:hypothetical protein